MQVVVGEPVNGTGSLLGLVLRTLIVLRFALHRFVLNRFVSHSVVVGGGWS